MSAQRPFAPLFADAALTTSIWSSLGLGYGGLFGLAPIIALELFGMDNWSMKYVAAEGRVRSNLQALTAPHPSPDSWGVISMSPILGSNTLNLLFGRIYDSHSVREAQPDVAT
jgi:hypothetical protein